ncbi:purine-nucleoside phosphorylase [Ruminococcus sp. OA3]|uniref:purine-nucleoside phosphorylase n=1 Tax=Ruminococcus sp. OA3 TaxID=2914164 RepID=UPI001F054306|nr:purine-nucleoside phosphorylase [Ruminococcus sp. OA3]MCH1982801.1 purine-nucleoside phosphorylase [Ruminococcus sp. OA3]
MQKEYERLRQCVEFIQKQVDFKPKAAVVLGSGLGSFAEAIDVCAVLPYCDIPGFPTSSVPGHAGRFVFGYVGSLPVVVMQGRVHYYEGYSIQDVVLPIRVMKLLGADTLLLTNAAGGLNTEYEGGNLMLITDQIASFVPSVLRGENIEELGERFPDMSEIYDRTLGNLVKECADELGIALKEGVYIQLPGPNYESPQEVKMCRLLGADAVGMSTACEAVAANHMGMKICGISCITNLACGLTDRPLSHQEVQEVSGRVTDTFQKLVRTVLERLG